VICRETEISFFVAGLRVDMDSRSGSPFVELMAGIGSKGEGETRVVLAFNVSALP